MTSFGKKVKETLEDVKDKTVGTTGNKDDKGRENDYTSSTTQSDPTREYESAEPMSPAKIKEHEPTAVRREDNTTRSSYSSDSSGSTSAQDPKERLRRSGMTEGTAGSTETGNEYEQGTAGTNK